MSLLLRSPNCFLSETAGINVIQSRYVDYLLY